MSEHTQTEDSELLKPKPKREQSEKQKAVWAKAQQTRLDNAQLKKDALAKVKESIENKKKAEPEPEPAKVPLAIKKPKVVYESDSESEVVVIKKKKKKPIVYEEESSEEEAPPPPPRKQKVTPPPIVAVPQKVSPVIRFF
mgnify:CR=1 FL=1|tara:strand:- start:243 stop:662 length:420 start_codon:yes stop_codon:yes gene_type:complete